MKKIQKILINTSLLIIFVSHSYGLVFNLSDTTKTGSAPNFPGYAYADPGEVLLDSTTHAGFNGIDDTFDGTLIFNFTLNVENFPGNQSYSTIDFDNTSAGDSPIAIGFSSSVSNFWNTFRLLNGGSNALNNLGTSSVIQGRDQTFTLTIDYNANALDSAILEMGGNPFDYDLGDFDYSFDKISFRNGYADNITSATNMLVTIVPEPATYALLSGALALVFVALRRRFKA